MRDGISETVAILVAVVVLVMVPVLLTGIKTGIITEARAEDSIYDTIKEINQDGCFTKAEMEYIIKVSALQKHPMHVCLYVMEGINNGDFGDYLYRVEEEQIYEMLRRQEVIWLPEGGVVSAYR